MKASEYLKGHWMEKKIWTHLLNPKHQKRLGDCAGFGTDNETETAIDVGCGLGHSTEIMKDCTPHIEWTGLDFYNKAITEGRKIFKDKLILLYRKDVAALQDPKMKDKYDSVICSEVIEHVEHDKELLIGLLNLAKKKIFITTPCKHVNDPGHLRVYNEVMIKNLLRKSILKEYGAKRVFWKIDNIFWYITIEK